MSKIYLRSFTLASDGQESKFLLEQKRTCYNGVYPFKLFPQKQLEKLRFGPVTILCGGNGSGKSTILNLIAEKLGVLRHSAFSGSAFFSTYVEMCSAESGEIPPTSQHLSSDDFFDYMLNIRYLNDGIDVRREELFEDYLDRKFASHRLKSLKEYDDWKESYDAKSKSQSQYVRYLLDEPENSLSVTMQRELAKYVSDSARYFGCQFIIATHSPILLSLPEATIYDLDAVPVAARPWTELENVRAYFDFFEEHRAEFLDGKDEPDEDCDPPAEDDGCLTEEKFDG